MKKRKKIVLISTISVILLLVTAGIIVAVNYDIIWANMVMTSIYQNYGGVTDFEKYQKDYEVAANIAYDYYLANSTPGSYFNFGENSDGEYLYWTLEGENLDYTLVHIPISQEEQKSLRNICELSFINKGGAQFNGVWVYENQVAFRTLDGGYALIYSVDGTKPKFVNKPDETRTSHYDKIADHWYHARSYG